MNEEIAEPQLRVSFQDDAITKLSDHIALQDKELLEAKRNIALLRDKLLELMEQVDHIGPARANERPPHY